MSNCCKVVGKDYIMEHVGKEKSPYHGVLLSSIILIIVPIAIYLLFNYYITKYQKFEEEFNAYSAVVLGFGVGFIFQFSCVIAGLTKGTLSVVISRIGELFSNLSISPRFALKCYIADIKENGIVFWIYFIIIGSCLGTTVISGIYLLLNFSNHFIK